MCSSSLVPQRDSGTTGGLVIGADHEHARRVMLASRNQTDRERSIESALNHAAGLGIVAVHEHAGPDICGVDDLYAIQRLASTSRFPNVFTYWGSINVDEARQLHAFGAGGDLCVDGSLGSRTALLRNPYQGQQSVGLEHLTADDVGQFLIHATQIGIQAGLHAIGDRAIQHVVAGLRIAVHVCGLSQVRALRHRIEHAEMVDVHDLAFLAQCGVVLSVQPSFDALWGGEAGMYANRLGPSRAMMMNPFAPALAAGVVLAFGSDSPVTQMSPWQAIRAATEHHHGDYQLGVRAAFQAHTRGGWRAVHDDGSGTLSVGAPAHFAVWDTSGLSMNVGQGASSGMGQHWSTDPRSGTPPLPDVTQGIPTALLTVGSGRVLFDPEKLWPDG